MKILPVFRRFHAYVNSFRGHTPFVDHNIDIKWRHTLQVCRHSVRIAHSLNLSREARALALLAALLHDSGRFPQIFRYGTFSDRASEDHARLGVREIKARSLLAELSRPQRRDILITVMLHNRLLLPPSLSPRELLLCRIIRDADKLDILDVLLEYYRSPDDGSNSALDLDLPDKTSLSPMALQDILAARPVNMAHVHSRQDFRLLQASWVFDVHFDYTMRRLRESGQIDWLLDRLPPVPGKDEAAGRIRQHMLGFRPSWPVS